MVLRCGVPLAIPSAIPAAGSTPPPHVIFGAPADVGPKATFEPRSFHVFERPEGIVAKRRRARCSPRTRVACLPCSMSKSACGAQRPCQRCIRLDMVDACVNRVHRKMGRPSASVAPGRPPAPGRQTSIGPARHEGCPKSAPLVAVPAKATGRRATSVWELLFNALLRRPAPALSGGHEGSRRVPSLDVPIPMIEISHALGAWHMTANATAQALFGMTDAQLRECIVTPASFSLMMGRDWKQMVDQVRRFRRIAPLYVTAVGANGTPTCCLLVVSVARDAIMIVLHTQSQAMHVVDG
ncbi:Zn(2)-C6 fungal-type domain-containing protein [Plasmodiophora brassicae]